MDHQRVELRIAFGKWKHDAAPVRLRRSDLVAAGVRRNLFRRQWTGRCKNHEWHFRGEDEVQTRADPAVRRLRASNYTVEFRGERGRVVDFEMLGFGPEPR